MDADQTDVYLRRLGLHLKAGRFDAARATINEAEQAAAEAERMQHLTIDEKLDLPLAMTSLPARIQNPLDARGIITVRDLLKCDRDKLLSIRSFTPRTLQEIADALADLGVAQAAFTT